MSPSCRPHALWVQSPFNLVCNTSFPSNFPVEIEHSYVLESLAAQDYCFFAHPQPSLLSLVTIPNGILLVLFCL